MVSNLSPPEISLIVNTYMKPRHLGLVLDSIERQQGIDGVFEVVVSDDGSTDETAAMVERRAESAPFRLAFTSRPHQGFQLARVRNDGARLAFGKRLLFLDGDCILPRNHVAVHLDRCREGIATGGDCGRLHESQSRSLDPTAFDPEELVKLLPPAERAALRRRLRKWRWYSLICHPTKPRLVGNNICIHRRDFEQVNGFDERFVGWGQEDDDISLRLRAAGVRLATVLDKTCSLHVWHPTDPTATARWRDGPNVQYFLRPGRLTRCRRGLVTRSLCDLTWRLPADLSETSSGRVISDILQEGSSSMPRSPAQTSAAEVDLVIRPGSSQFQSKTYRPARGLPTCRVLVLEGQVRVSPAVERQADVVIRAPASPPASLPSLRSHIEESLENIG